MLVKKILCALVVAGIACSATAQPSCNGSSLILAKDGLASSGLLPRAYMSGLSEYVKAHTGCSLATVQLSLNEVKAKGAELSGVIVTNDSNAEGFFSCGARTPWIAVHPTVSAELGELLPSIAGKPPKYRLGIVRDMDYGDRISAVVPYMHTHRYWTELEDSRQLFKAGLVHAVDAFLFYPDQYSEKQLSELAANGFQVSPLQDPVPVGIMVRPSVNPEFSKSVKEFFAVNGC